MFRCPPRVLSYIVWEPSSNKSALAALLQWLEGLNYSLAVPLLWALQTQEGRLTVGGWCTTPSSLGGRVGFDPLLLLQALPAEMGIGVKSKGIDFQVCSPVRKPEWLVRYKDVDQARLAPKPAA